MENKKKGTAIAFNARGSFFQIPDNVPGVKQKFHSVGIFLPPLSLGSANRKREASCGTKSMPPIGPSFQREREEEGDEEAAAGKWSRRRRRRVLYSDSLLLFRALVREIHRVFDISSGTSSHLAKYFDFLYRSRDCYFWHFISKLVLRVCFINAVILCGGCFRSEPLLKRHHFREEDNSTHHQVQKPLSPCKFILTFATR